MWRLNIQHACFAPVSHDALGYLNTTLFFMDMKMQ